MAFYRVEHETRYVYESAVATSQHVAYLRPRELPRQRVTRAEVLVEPAPARVAFSAKHHLVPDLLIHPSAHPLLSLIHI